MDVAEGKSVMTRKIVTVIKAKKPGEADIVRELTIEEPASPQIRVDVAIYLSDCAYGKPAQSLNVDPEAADAIGDILEASRQRAALRARCEQEAKQLPDT